MVKTIKSNKILISSLILLMSIFVCFTAKAQISIISDEETEIYLEKIAKPIFKSAGQNFDRNSFFIVNDESLNAFVSDGNLLFINTGTIISSKSDDEISGVIAHEVGHIKGGHILRSKIREQQLTEASLASMLLAGAAAIASGRGDVGMAIALGGQSSIMNSFFKYRVQEERSADEAAIKILEDIKVSPKGLHNFMKKIAQQNIITGVEEVQYFRTHPVTKERLAFLEKSVKDSPYGKQENVTEEFSRVKAKLIAFIYSPNIAKKYYPKNQTISEKYANAIIFFKEMKINDAMKNINDLIELEPKNPFFRELKAQIHMETGNVTSAKDEYKKALDLLPNSTNIKTSYAHAVLESVSTSSEIKDTENILNQVILVKPSYEAWILLARTYDSQKKSPEATYASAEASFRIGLFDVAKKQANDAKKIAKSNNLKLKIEDLLNRIEVYKKDID